MMSSSSGVKISERKNTISGYDIVVQLSEEAVNYQLQKLYDTPLPANSLPPPPADGDLSPGSFIPPAQAEYYINHNFNLRRIDEDGEIDPAGITGFIECPKIRFRPILPKPRPGATTSAADGTGGAQMDQYRKAYVEITFKADSFVQRDPVLNRKGQLVYKKSIPLEGYRMVWATQIARADIENVMERIIEPAKSKDSNVVLKDSAMEKLTNYVDPRVFSVSSIFCLMEESTMIESFAVLDKEGYKVTEFWVADILTKLYRYFADLQERTPTGAMTPELPFVFGYTVSQTAPDIKSILPNASTAKTPKYFIPKQFRLTVTPGQTNKPEAETATKGTLNFCMLTHRDGESGAKTNIDASDFNAGIIDRDFFDKTFTRARVRDSNGKLQGHDAIMAVSRELFMEKWVRSILDKLLVDPDSAYRDVLRNAKGIGSGSFSFVKKPIDFESRSDYFSASQKWRMTPVDRPRKKVATQAVEQGEKEGGAFGFLAKTIGRAIVNTDIGDWALGQMTGGECADENPYDEQQFATGQSSVRIYVESELSNIRSFDAGTNARRRITLDIRVENELIHIARTRGINGKFQDASETKNYLRSHCYGFNSDIFKESDNENDWLLARAIECRISSRIVVNIDPGAAGTWSINIDRQRSENILPSDGQVHWQELTKDNLFSFGNLMRFRKFHTFRELGTQEGDLQFQRNMKPNWTSNTASFLNESMNECFKNMGNTIILPLGSIFTFAGLDMGSDGTLYSQINYALPADANITATK